MRRLVLAAALALVLPRPICADIYTVANAIAFANEPYRHIFIRHETAPNFGLKVTYLNPNLLSTNANAIHSIYSVSEGAIYPAWYSSHTPDATNFTHTQGTGSGSNTYYFNLSTDARYCNWNVPAAANGATSIMVGMLSLIGGGDVQVVKNPDGDATVIATLSTNDTANDYRRERFATLSESVATGDVIRLRRVPGGASARVWGIALYNTSSVADDSSSLVMPSPVAVTYTGSGVEFAYNIGPRGSAQKFVGSYAHQGGTYGVEVSPVESWTKDGASWTPEVGYSVGSHVLVRTTVAYYDAGNADIAHISLVESFSPRQITTNHRATASVDLQTGALYAAMWPAITTTARYEFDSSFSVARAGRGIRYYPNVGTIDASVQDDAIVTTDKDHRIARAVFAPSGNIPTVRLISTYGAGGITSIFVIRDATFYDKLYFQQQVGLFPSGTTWYVDSGAVWGGVWTLRLRDYSGLRPYVIGGF